MSKTDGKKVDNSHIIPEVYLRNFIFEDKEFNNESVYISNINSLNTWKRKGIKKKPFSEHQFYDFSTIDDTIQTVEKYLGTIESKIKSSFDRIKKEEELKEEDYISILRFIISMQNRTKLMQKNWQQMANTLHEWFKDFSNEEYANEYFHNYEDFSKWFILLTDKIIKESHFFIDSFFILKNFTTIPFITSDNPVICRTLYKSFVETITKKTVNSDNVINHRCIILPISRNYCIFYCDYLSADTTIIIDEEEIVHLINILQIENAEEWLISDSDNTNFNYNERYKIIQSVNLKKRLLVHTSTEEFSFPIENIKNNLSVILNIPKEVFNQILLNGQIQDIVVFSDSEEHHMKTPTVKCIEETESVFRLRFSNLPFDIEYNQF